MPNNTTLDAIQAMGRAPSILKVAEAFRRAVEPYGYPHFMCTAAPEAEKAGEAVIFQEWPREWLTRYGQRKYHLRDPMVREMCYTAEPFIWTEALQRSPYAKADREIVYEASHWNMCQGLVIPIYGVGGEAHAITMAGLAPRTDSEARAELRLISIYAHGHAVRLRSGNNEIRVQLRAREREVLRWVAAGKTDFEIGCILGISASAAHKHVENAKRKFGVPTRIQAVVAAMRQGHIRP